MRKGLAFVMLLTMSANVQATELSWLTNYGDALKMAQTTARPLLLVISRDELLPVSTDRSNPGQVAQLSHDLPDAYVLCKIDANSGYGKRVAEAFRVTEFPHSVIIDKTAKKVLYSRSGRATDDTLKATLAKYQGEATFRRVFVTQPRTNFQSSSRTYGRTYSFRQPAICNT